MIDRARLVEGAKKFLPGLEADLRERLATVDGVDAPLRAEYATAREYGRTAATWEAWRDGELTQIAAAWFLGCVYVRFLEDNGLLPEPLLSGPGEARRRAQNRHEAHFKEHPAHTDRDYLLAVFEEVSAYPVVQALFDRRHNPLYRLGPSADGARALVGFWRELGVDGTLAHDFTDPTWNTRFLGDLYQDLSEAVRKKYALLQTPEFVEAFILDRTLERAIKTFGPETVTLIDPTCGSGHFLLGAFRRLFERHRENAPAANPRELAQRALTQIAGVDINPYAVAIARLRLLLAALVVSEIRRLADAPGFTLQLATGDSLLHGRRPGEWAHRQERLVEDELYHVYHAEDEELLKEILGRQYHAVVGNPPYITVKDRAMNAAYRERFKSCHRQYSLAVPFFERFFDLAIRGGDGGDGAGFVGMITSNSFMKREFGKKLIEQFIPKWDLTHVIDTSGAYIPGHGTPTVIPFGRNRKPTTTKVRAVMGIRGEPTTPEIPAEGNVWKAILQAIDNSGFENEFVSAEDVERSKLETHPWSLGGGGASDLKTRIETESTERLGSIVQEIGFVCLTRADPAYFAPRSALARKGNDDRNIAVLVEGQRS